MARSQESGEERPKPVEYDELKATVRVPKGETLARSRETPGAHRGFTHGPDRNLKHAEIFLDDETEPEYAPVDMSWMDDEEWERYEQERAEAMAELVSLAILAATKAAPHVRRWWADRGSPYIRKLREKRKKRRSKALDGKFVAVYSEVEEEAELSVEPQAAMEVYEPPMTQDDATRHLVEALVARRFIEEKMKLLASSRIEDVDQPAELASAVQALTEGEVRDALSALLASNPEFRKVAEVSLAVEPTEAKSSRG